jgi:hypothetical protein
MRVDEEDEERKKVVRKESRITSVGRRCCEEGEMVRGKWNPLLQLN